jgi:glycosyltransferase involved in cell wall biosynthesis
VNPTPLVSIAIPAFNPEFFRSTLLSAIGQDYANLEIVICDDTQGDEIKAIVDELKGKTSIALHYVRNSKTLGFACNLQACFERSQGEFIKFLCDDDTLFSSCITEQANVLSACLHVSIVINQRLLCDAEDNLLPSRPLNCVMSPGTAVLNGGDVLEIMDGSAVNLLGGISHALFRRGQVEACLATLVQDGQGFISRLDSALYVCLLRHGHLVCLSNVLSLERMHPGRLSHRAAMTLAFKNETQWLLQMLAERVGEPAPAKGWVRFLALRDYQDGVDKVWEEFEMGRLFTAQTADYLQQVGTNSLSFAELYDEWLTSRSLSAGQFRVLPKRIEQWPSRPRIIPVIRASQGDELALRITLESLTGQSYAPSQVWLLAPADFSVPPVAGVHVQQLALRGNGFEQLNQRLANEQGADWIFLLQAGDRLHPDAFVIMAERVAVLPNRLCLYTDEGGLDNLDATAPVFKPDFNFDLMRSFPYVGRLLAFQCAALRDLGGFAEEFEILAPHDLLWRMVEANGLHVVEHIVEVLVQCQSGYGEFLNDPIGHRQASRVVGAHLQRLGVAAQVQSTEGALISRVNYLYDSMPKVSILIGAGNDLQALVRCIESIVEHTAYDNYEVLVIYGGDESPLVRTWLMAMRDAGGSRLRMVSVDAQGTAARLNEAGKQALGDYLLLLDTGCVVVERHWLSELVSQGQRSEVGIVGPMLCKEDGKVHSAGLILGLRGPAGTPFLDSPLDSSGYMSRMQLVQNLSAVSLECLLVRREAFNAVDGLDAEHLNANLFDADFCLRVAEQGYLVVWTPFARVVRMANDNDAGPTDHDLAHDQDAFYQRWLPRVAQDPAYNRNFSLKLSGFDFESGKRGGWDPFISRTLPSVVGLPINIGAVGHYRVAQPFNELERAGWIQGRLTYGVPDTIELQRLQPDTVIFQCRYSADSIQEFQAVKRFSNARRIYELDDYIIEVPKKNAHARNMPTNMRERVSQGIALCDRVVVSTEPLADALSSMHSDIRVVPNMLAASLWAGLQGQRQTSARPRVGWAGGTSHRGDLELILDVVKELADEVDWVFFGMCPELLKPYVKEFHGSIPLGMYPQKLASLNLDLALAPLEINLFNDCKSNLRLLEYGACGFPVICTDTKAYRGYLPCTRVRDNSAREWLDAIRMHLADPGASYRQGDALREVVLRDYVLTENNLQLWANAWLAD